MKNKVFYLVALAVGMVFVMSGCKDCDDPSDPDCGNYDPCFGQEEFKPHFKMYDAIKHWSGELFAYPVQPPVQPYFTNYILTEGDTLLTNGVIFIAPEGYDSVWWRIGAEGSFRHGKDVTLDFDRLYPSNLPIVMIGKRTPNIACFPNEQTLDTVRRFLTLWPNDSTKLLGKWIGAYDTHPNDSFEIVMKFKENSKELSIDYFPDRDSKDVPMDGSIYHITKTNMYGKVDTRGTTHFDRYGRKFFTGYTIGRVHGTNFQHLEIKLKYHYDSVSPVVKHDIKFNARRK